MKNFFQASNKILHGFLEDFSRIKVEKACRSHRQKIFLRKEKKFWIEQACIESSVIFYCFRFKVRLAF